MAKKVQKEKIKPAHFSTEVMEDPDTGDLVIQFPEEFIKKADWREGDTLAYEVEDGKVLVKNASKEARDAELPLFVVETVQVFRHKYLIRAKSLEHAYDTVTMEDAEEVSQKWLGETITGGRTVSEAEAQVIHEGEDDPDTLSSPWLPLDQVVHKVEY